MAIDKAQEAAFREASKKLMDAGVEYLNHLAPLAQYDAMATMANFGNALVAMMMNAVENAAKPEATVEDKIDLMADMLKDRCCAFCDAYRERHEKGAKSGKFDDMPEEMREMLKEMEAKGVKIIRI